MGATINGLFREDTYELPISAIREMIANAVLHRSYLDQSCIQDLIIELKFLLQDLYLAV